MSNFASVWNRCGMVFFLRRYVFAGYKREASYTQRATYTCTQSANVKDTNTLKVFSHRNDKSIRWQQFSAVLLATKKWWRCFFSHLLSLSNICAAHIERKKHQTTIINEKHALSSTQKNAFFSVELLRERKKENIMSIDNNAVKLVQMNTTCFVNLFSAWNYDRKEVEKRKMNSKGFAKQKINDESKENIIETHNSEYTANRILFEYIKATARDRDTCKAYTQPIQQQQWSFRFLFSLFSRNRHTTQQKKTHSHLLDIPCSFSLSRCFFFHFVLHCTIYPPYDFFFLFSLLLLLFIRFAQSIIGLTVSMNICVRPFLFASFRIRSKCEYDSIEHTKFAFFHSKKKTTLLNASKFYRIIFSIFAFVLIGFDMGQQNCIYNSQKSTRTVDLRIFFFRFVESCGIFSFRRIVR